jgi:glycosyltransferase involved in cell wall biosynthesis
MNTQKPKLLVVFHSSNLYSGATRSLTDIMDYLIKTEKYDIEVIFPDTEGSALDYYRNLHIPVYSYKYGKLMQGLTQPLIRRCIKLPLLFTRFFYIQKEAKHAAEKLRKNCYDIVYSNTSCIVFGGYLGLKLRSKQIWHIREFRKEDHQIAFFLGDKYLKKFINRCADKVLFVSKSVMDKHKDFIDQDKMVVTYNSYSPNFISSKQQFNRSDTLNVLLAGDVKPSKGQMITIKAIEQVIKRCGPMSFKLHLAGKASDQSYYSEIESYVIKNGLSDSVIIYGQVSDMQTLRNQMDVGIIASINEAFGRTTIEGMLCMLAMIGRNSGGTVEQIKDCETGLLYNGTVDDLVDKLIFYYYNREEMIRMAVNGFKESVEMHTKGRCGRIVEEVVDYVLADT